MIGKHQNKLVEGLVPEVITMGNLVKVLQNLLNEGVPIRDMRTILQTLVEYAPRSQDPEVLTAACRIALRRLIVQEIAGPDPELPVITLAPELERILHQSLQAGVVMAPASSRVWRSGCNARWWKPLNDKNWKANRPCF